MAEQTTTTVVTLSETPEAFVADRQRFWVAFTRFATGAVIVVVILLLLGWAFLV